eukprot:4408983-Amphidinium_carterae.1
MACVAGMLHNILCTCTLSDWHIQPGQELIECRVRPGSLQDTANNHASSSCLSGHKVETDMKQNSQPLWQTKTKWTIVV